MHINGTSKWVDLVFMNKNFSGTEPPQIGTETCIIDVDTRSLSSEKYSNQSC